MGPHRSGLLPRLALAALVVLPVAATRAATAASFDGMDKAAPALADELDRGLAPAWDKPGRTLSVGFIANPDGAPCRLTSVLGPRIARQLQAKGYRIVESTFEAWLDEEQARQRRVTYNQEMAAELGKRIGASALVFGTAAAGQRDDRLDVDLWVTDVATGERLAGAGATIRNVPDTADMLSPIRKGKQSLAEAVRGNLALIVAAVVAGLVVIGRSALLRNRPAAAQAGGAGAAARGMLTPWNGFFLLLGAGVVALLGWKLGQIMGGWSLTALAVVAGIAHALRAQAAPVALPVRLIGLCVLYCIAAAALVRALGPAQAGAVLGGAVGLIGGLLRLFSPRAPAAE